MRDDKRNYVVVGAFVLAMVEVFWSAYFDIAWKDVAVFGLLILWLPGLLLASKAALLAALFGHVYIWVHYFTVEQPDMIHIYGNKGDSSS